MAFRTIGRLAAAVALSFAPATALAQAARPEPPAPVYRDGEPAVLAPPPPPEDPQAHNRQVSAAFRGWYARAKRPAMMVFWNRELTDEAITQYVESQVSREQTQGSQNGVGGKDSPASSSQTVQSKVASQETSRRAVTGGRYAPMDPLLSSQLEAAFQSAWLGLSVELVDRNAIIRAMSTVATDAQRADTQLLESVSLKQGVEYLIEVLPIATSASPTGLVFQVRVKHLPSSTLVAQFNTSALPPAGPASWSAGPGGFQKRAGSSPTDPESIGAELAFQTMARFR